LIDYKNVLFEIESLLNNYDAGRAITEGVDTVIAGKPNVGKSTLMNYLAGFRRSIVTDIAGTTRDVVEDTVRLGNVVLHLADTAGIRETGNEVEKIGVDFAVGRVERAALVLAVFDMSREFDSEDKAVLELCKDKCAVAVVKGLRAVSDFEYEFQQAQMNKKLNNELETIFINTRVENLYLSSSAVKQICELGGDISDFVPEIICEDIVERIKRGVSK
jgi:pantetheine-phosphate adenylyltransferase